MTAAMPTASGARRARRLRLGALVAAGAVAVATVALTPDPTPQPRVWRDHVTGGGAAPATNPAGTPGDK